MTLSFTRQGAGGGGQAVVGFDPVLQQQGNAVEAAAALARPAGGVQGPGLAIQLLKVLDAGTGREYEEKLRAGGLGYGDLKKETV